MLKISHFVYIFRANNYVLKYDADEKQLGSNLLEINYIMYAWRSFLVWSFGTNRVCLINNIELVITLK